MKCKKCKDTGIILDLRRNPQTCECSLPNKRAEDLKKMYWDGNLNKAFRFWWYLNKGLDIFNQFKYLFAFFIGIYFALKLKNILWLVGMSIVSLPILIVVGYFAVHHVGKVLDWLNVKYSTHYAKGTYDILEGQLKELQRINENLKKNS